MNEIKQCNIDYFKSNLTKEAFEFLPKELSKSVDFALYVIKQNVFLIDFFSNKVVNDPLVIKELKLNLKSHLFPQKGYFTFYKKSEIRNNKDFVLYAVKYHYKFLLFACKDFRDDEEIITRGIKYNVEIYRYASNRVKSIPFIAESAVTCSDKHRVNIFLVPPTALSKILLRYIVKNRCEYHIIDEQKKNEKVTKNLLLLIKERSDNTFDSLWEYPREVIDNLIPKFIKKGYMINIEYQSSRHYYCELVENTISSWTSAMIDAQLGYRMAIDYDDG